jgi:Holliday junction resolvase-like predicted endonuclease
MIVPYARFYENKSRKYVNGRRYRLGNPSHPCYDYYKQHGMYKTLDYMKITGVNSSKHSPSRQGDLAEFYAVTWLWDQGYEVFPNAGSTGMVDMIAWKPETNEIILIDVKTTRTKNIQRGAGLNRTAIQKEKGVRILNYNADSRVLYLVKHGFPGRPTKLMRNIDEQFNRRYI